MRFSVELDSNLNSLYKELQEGRYKVGGYRIIYIYVPKKRLIMALQFRDRVLQWAIYRLLIFHVFIALILHALRPSLSLLTVFMEIFVLPAPCRQGNMPQRKWCEMLEEMGKILGSWLKKLNS